jgi:mannose/fructose/N-acetylgalactosamine-specific phosphotransferase system component IIC
MSEMSGAAASAGALFEPHTLLRLLGLGFWTGVDMTAFLQILISQPLAAAWLGGLVAGDPTTGLAVGLVLQGVWSRSLPLGSSPLPGVGPASVAAGAVAASAGGGRTALGPALTVPEAAPLAVALLLGVVLATILRPLLAAKNRRRAFIHRMAHAAAERGRPQGVVAANLLGALPSGLLGLVTVALGVGAGGIVLILIGDRASGDGRWVAIPVLAVGLGQMASLAGGKRVWAWVGAVLLVGGLSLGAR